MNFRIVAEADAEMHNAANNYDESVEGLGEAFLKELEQLLQSIFESPKLGVRISGNVYRRVLKRFPFNVLYTVSDTEIVVVSIMHQRRLPGYWEDRQ